MTHVDDFLAETFAEFVDEILDGGMPDIDRAIEQHEELRDRIEEIHELAHRVAGRHQPARPRFAGYEILSELGRGGMGTVFLARQRDLGRTVALKVVPPGVASSARTARRFLDEARTLARLTDDRIIRIYNIIEHDDALAYAMEWVDGCSLASLIEQLRRLRRAPTMIDVGDALRSGELPQKAKSYLQYVVGIGIAAGRALGVVHRSGIVHRDVKPSNILIRRNGAALLADFGLAHVADSSLTATGTFLGTTYYASPEQLRATDADEIDGRSDVYSLAATLFEAITLRPRHVARSTFEVLRAIDDQSPPSVRKMAPHLPRDLDTILKTALEPDRNQRYQSADEFADDLERMSLLLPIHARPAGIWKRATKFLRRQRRFVVATVCGAALVGAVWLLVAQRLDESAARARRAAEHVTAARSELLVSIGDLWRESARWRSAHAGSWDWFAADRPLRAALDQYALAEGMAADKEAIRNEQAVVAFAERLGTVPAGELVAETRRWPAEWKLTAAFAARVARAPRSRDSISDEVLEGAAPDDRHLLGMLAFLTGNVPVCERAWESVDPARPNDAFVNAALALLHRADGNCVAAYPLLERALPDFPNALPLALDLAELAADLGHADLAERWLGHALGAGVDPDHHALVRIQAEVAWLRGDVSRAREVLQRLVAQDAADSQSRFRLAQIALADGDSATALAQLKVVIRLQPHAAHVRRQLAEVALRVGDLRCYLAQARHVVGEISAGDRSDHSIDELLDVLRIGGMTEHYRALVEATGRRPAMNRASIVPESWPQSNGGFQREHAESALATVARFDSAAGRVPVLIWASGWHRRVITATSLACRAWTASTRLRSLVDPGWRRLIDVAVAAVVENWSGLAPGLRRVTEAIEVRFTGMETAWQRVDAESSPPLLADHVLVADRNGLVLFGGIGEDYAPRADTWRWDGGTWRELDPAVRPAPRLRHAAAFDPDRGRIVLFGGSRDKRSGWFGDTWEFDGSTWRRIDVQVAPSARNDHALAWDSVTRRVILFGGHDEAGGRDDTWAFDGTTWVELSPARRPPARRDHNLVTDSSRGRLVMFGGFAVTGQIPAAVWEWDGRDWHRVEPAGFGFARAGAGGTFDPIRGSTIAFGGLSGVNRAGTYWWDGRTWRQCNVLMSPHGRAGHAMAFDPISEQPVLFGGFVDRLVGDTWVLTGWR